MKNTETQRHREKQVHPHLQCGCYEYQHLKFLETCEKCETHLADEGDYKSPGSEPPHCKCGETGLMGSYVLLSEAKHPTHFLTKP